MLKPILICLVHRSRACYAIMKSHLWELAAIVHYMLPEFEEMLQNQVFEATLPKVPVVEPEEIKTADEEISNEKSKDKIVIEIDTSSKEDFDIVDVVKRGDKCKEYLYEFVFKIVK